MKTLRVLTGTLASGLLLGVASADIPYLDLCGVVTVNGVAQAGVTVEVIPCDGAAIPGDWPAPNPSTTTTAFDPAAGINWLLIYSSGQGSGSFPGPAGSFTFMSPLNGAWYTAIDVQLKFTCGSGASVIVPCADVRAAFDATIGTDHLGKAVVNVEVTCDGNPPPPPPTDDLVSGDTATIGFWHNKNGQALIKSLNGGSSSTSLGNWLASNFPNLFGANAGAYNLTDKSNKAVAALDLKFFGRSGPKVEAQILGAALAVYVTDSDLAGDAGKRYGFNISADGTGEKEINVGSLGAPIGLNDNGVYTVLELLQQADAQKGAGTFNARAFNAIFNAINELGDR